MKTFTSIAIAFFLVLSVVPAMAADQAGSNREPVTFQALSNMPATALEALTPLTETELASIEGSGFCLCPALSAVVTQSNTVSSGTVGSAGLSAVGGGPGSITAGSDATFFKVIQANFSIVRQRIR